MLANMLGSPLAAPPGGKGLAYVAFDLDPARVRAARTAGFTVVYGDGARWRLDGGRAAGHPGGPGEGRRGCGCKMEGCWLFLSCSHVLS